MTSRLKLSLVPGILGIPSLDCSITQRKIEIAQMREYSQLRFSEGGKKRAQPQKDKMHRPTCLSPVVDR